MSLGLVAWNLTTQTKSPSTADHYGLIVLEWLAKECPSRNQHCRKASDLLDRVFEEYFNHLKLANLMRKTAYHRLAALAQPEELDKEVSDVLDQIVEVGQKAQSEGA